MTRLSLALIPLALSLSACAETYTIRQLGHPEFEQVVGKDTRFRRADDQQRGQLDAYPEGGEEEGDHRCLATIIPIGVEEVVVLDVRAGQRPPTGLPLRSLTVGAYALTAEQGQAYARSGALPDPDAPLIVLTTRDKNEDGVLALGVQLPRDAIPAGTEKLAFPVLIEFEDGWIVLVNYQTGIPTVVPTIDPNQTIEGETPATPPENPAPTEHPGR